MEYKGAIFDLDGTLIDSMGLWYQVDVDFFAQCGVPMPEDYSAKVSQMGAWQTAEYTIDLLGLPYTPQELIGIWNGMVREEYLYKVPLKPFTRDYLEYLKGEGIATAVATTLFPELYEPVLQRTGVYSFFDAFVSAGTLKLEKSTPEVYLTAAGKMQVSPEDCMVFEDIIAGIQGARAAGMYTIGVYDRWDRTNQQLLKEAAHKYIMDFSELLPVPE